MKNFLLDNCFEIFLGIFFIGLIVLFIMFEYKFFVDNELKMEKECFNFYKENNYILEECSKFEDKLKGRKK